MAFEQDMMSANVGKSKGNHVVRVVERGRDLCVRIDRPSGIGNALYETFEVSVEEAKALWPLLRSMSNS
jgi:hypothetical protein